MNMQRYAKMRIRILNLDIKYLPHFLILLKNIILIACISFYDQDYSYRLPRHHDIPKRVRYKIMHPSVKSSRLTLKFTVGLGFPTVLLWNLELLFYVVFEVLRHYRAAERLR